MTYSYDPTRIRAWGKDQMRFELGDTQVDGGADTCFLADEEYEAFLEGVKPGIRTWNYAKLKVLEAILFKASYQVDTKIDVLEYKFGDRADRLQKLYDALKKQVAAAASVPTLPPSMTRESPYFYKGMQENRAAMHPENRHGGPSEPFRRMTS